MPTYDPTKVSVSFNKATIAGYGGSTFVKASRNEDAYTLTMGADGGWVRTRNANQSGRVEVTLLSSAPGNDTLAAQALLDELSGTGTGAVLVKDAGGTAYAAGQDAWIVKHADLERAKEAGEVTWIIESPVLKLQNGGAVLTP